MQVVVIGEGGRTERRRQAVQGVPQARLAGPPTAAGGVLEPDAPPSVLDALLQSADVAFVAAPTSVRFRVAERAAKQGVHVFLEWPPATSVRECEALVELAEEAGIEAGVSRPLRFHPVVGALPGAGRVGLILLRREIPEAAAPAWPDWLAGALDLCCALAESSSVQRVDAESAPGEAAWPEAVAFALRFHNGAYAQVSLRRSTTAPAHALYLAGPEGRRATELDDEDPALLQAETTAFLEAVAAERPAPVSALDGLHTMRLAERLMQRLR